MPSPNKIKRVREKCEICSKNATFRFSPDLDIKGLGSCNKHQKEVHTAYIALVTSGLSMYKAIIKGFQGSAPKKDKK